jgi:hypothetical protein
MAAAATAAGSSPHGRCRHTAAAAANHQRETRSDRQTVRKRHTGTQTHRDTTDTETPQRHRHTTETQTHRHTDTDRQAHIHTVTQSPVRRSR